MQPQLWKKTVKYCTFSILQDKTVFHDSNNSNKSRSPLLIKKIHKIIFILQWHWNNDYIFFIVLPWHAHTHRHTNCKPTAHIKGSALYDLWCGAVMQRDWTPVSDWLSWWGNTFLSSSVCGERLDTGGFHLTACLSPDSADGCYSVGVWQRRKSLYTGHVHAVCLFTYSGIHQYCDRP